MVKFFKYNPVDFRLQLNHELENLLAKSKWCIV